MDPTSRTQTNLKEIRDLKAEDIKPPEENGIINLCYLGLGNGFKGMTTKAEAEEKKREGEREEGKKGGRERVGGSIKLTSYTHCINNLFNLILQ